MIAKTKQFSYYIYTHIYSSGCKDNNITPTTNDTCLCINIMLQSH